MSDKPDPQEQMLGEYDFSKGVRGKYSERYAQGRNLILVDSDLLDEFPDAKSVNDALRRFRQIKQIAQG
jgi:hypothetical protein